MSTRFVLLPAFLLLCACAGREPQPMQEPVHETVMGGPRPSSSLDVTQSGDLTTIELLKEKAQEIVNLKKRVAELEGALKESEQKARQEAQSASEQGGQLERLQQLLTQVTADQRQLNERVLSLEIEKLELEKKILNMKLASLGSESN